MERKASDPTASEIYAELVNAEQDALDKATACAKRGRISEASEWLADAANSRRLAEQWRD